METKFIKVAIDIDIDGCLDSSPRGKLPSSLGWFRVSVRIRVGWGNIPSGQLS